MSHAFIIGMAVAMIISTTQTSPTPDSRLTDLVERLNSAVIPRPMDPRDQRYSMVGAIFLNNASYPMCSGTLVGRRTVLTARHCISTPESELRPGEKLEFAFGPGFNALLPVSTILHQPRSKVVQVMYGYPGEDFDPKADTAKLPYARQMRRLTADWAIMILSEPLGDIYGFMDVSWLGAEDLYFEKPFSVAGYGIRFEDVDNTRLLHGVPHIREEVTVLAYDDFLKKGKRTFSMISGGAVGGDSGGPIFLSDMKSQGEDKHTLYGVVTKGSTTPEGLSVAGVVSGEDMRIRVMEANAAFP